MKALSSGNLLSFHPEHVTICPRLASASAAISSAAASSDITARIAPASLELGTAVGLLQLPVTFTRPFDIITLRRRSMFGRHGLVVPVRSQCRSTCDKAARSVCVCVYCLRTPPSFQPTRVRGGTAGSVLQLRGFRRQTTHANTCAHTHQMHGRTNMVEANPGFQDHMFAMYTGASLKQMGGARGASADLGGRQGVGELSLQLDVAEIGHTNAVALQIVLASPVVALSSTCEFLHPFTRSLSPLSLSLFNNCAIQLRL